MKFAKLTKKISDKKYSATFGIMLDGIYVTPANEHKNDNKFTLSLLAGQMDFIHSIHDTGLEYAIELRYFFDPDAPFRITVYFLVQTTAATKSRAVAKSKNLENYFLNLLQVINNLYKFKPLADRDRLSYLIEPFEFNSLAEIVRREDVIPLDSVRKKNVRHLGFGSSGFGSQAEKKDDKSSRIYYIFPYLLNLNNMERLCNILLLQNYPCLISICMQPYFLTDKDEADFEARNNLCEKYSQLNFNSAGDIEQLAPFLKKQASALYKKCSATLTQLEDAAFFQKVQIVSSHPIENEVAGILGTAITEHAGHPKLAFNNENDKIFAGGYDCYRPETDDRFTIALNNLKYMQFNSWIPGMADVDFKHWRYLFNVSQASAAFRLPFPLNAEFPGIDTLQFHHKTAPADLPSSGLLIGEYFHHNQSRKVYFKENDRRRHTYVVGQTGTGKSTLFQQMILQDIYAGKGVGVIDPHGELIEEILLCIPAKRKKDVVYINPKDFNFPVGINLLKYQYPYEKDFCVNYLLEVFDVLYDLKQTGGPIFEQYMRNCLYLLLDQPDNFKPTILDTVRIFHNSAFRKSLLKTCTNIYVRNFWEKEAELAGGDARMENIAPYINSKLSRIVYNDIIRCILGQRRSTINFREIMDKKKVLLVDLRKGLLGDTNSHFLGMIVVGKLLSAALSRSGAENKSKLPDFFLYVDEFQNLATQTFVSILSEARKYRLSLTVTNQYIAQLKENVRHGIFGNVGTLMSFRVGSDDALLLSKEYGDLISKNDLMGLSNWNVYLRLLVDGNVSTPFNMRTLMPGQSKNFERMEKILELSRKRYGRPREDVEKEMQESWRLDEN